MPRVSVLIPSYNHETYLPLALGDVFAQSFQDYEIVVVDDGSTDGSLKYLQSLGSRIRLFSQQNRGTYATLNRCIEEARSPLLAILNSDDRWMADKLEKQAAVMDKNPSIGLVHTSGHFIDGDGNRLDSNPMGFPWPRTDQSNAIELFVRYNRIVPSSAMIRKVCFERLGGFDESLYGLGDWDMWLRLALEYDIAFIDEPLTHYRVHSANASYQNQKMLIDECWIREHTIHGREADYWQRAPSRWGMRMALAHSYACLGTERAMLGRHREARQAYWQSLRRCPWRLKSLYRIAWTYFKKR